VFSENKKKLLEILFCKFIIKKKKRKWDSDVVSAAVTAVVSTSHVYS
jgi:hypothetical protein